MVFNSLRFLIFFPVVAALYFLLTMRLGSRRPALANTLSQLFLLAASLFFYACWNPAYLALLLISVAVTWISGLLMEGAAATLAAPSPGTTPLAAPPRTAGQKRLILAASLVINLAILFFFKYYGFFADAARGLTGGGIHLPEFNVLLPVGISFYTFQALGYSIDVYYGRVRAERNFVTYALFVTFFPQLVAGPIERTGNLLPQFKDGNHRFDYDRVTAGLRLAAWGMFKKVVIADRLALYVNAVYGTPDVYPAAALALATFFFTFQIYCDFSGYSDIAIGCARVLGFNLMTNFRRPYFSRSVSEFWRRWHISLSTWLKDYLYIPLGGNRKGALRQKLNLLITFLLSGLWHGAAWHFVAWGALHGIFQVVGKTVSKTVSSGQWAVSSFRSRRKQSTNADSGASTDIPDKKLSTAHCPLPTDKKLPTAHCPLPTVFTFALVSFAWIFFRANSMHDAFVIIGKLTALPAEMAGYVRQIPAAGVVGTVRAALQLGIDVAHPIEAFGLTNFGFSVIFICVLLAGDLFTRKMTNAASDIARAPLVLRWAGYYALLLSVLLSWDAGQAQFIYFTF